MCKLRQLTNKGLYVKLLSESPEFMKDGAAISKIAVSSKHCFAK